jgi:hypothetical protein
VIQPSRHAVEGNPESSTNTRQTVASPLVQEVLGPVAIPLGSDEGSIVGWVRRLEYLGLVFRESAGVDLHACHGLPGFFQGVAVGAHLGEQLTGCLESVLHILCVDQSEGFSPAEGQRQRVLADDAYARELDLNAALAVVAVGQQQVFVSDVVTVYPQLSKQLGWEPVAFSLTERTCRVIAGGILADNGVEEPEGLVVGRRFEVAVVASGNAASRLTL